MSSSSLVFLYPAASSPGLIPLLPYSLDLNHEPDLRMRLTGSDCGRRMSTQTEARARYYNQYSDENGPPVSPSADTVPMSSSWTPNFASSKIDTAPRPPRRDSPPSSLRNSWTPEMDGRGAPPIPPRPKLTLRTAGEPLSRDISRTLNGRQTSNYSHPLAYSQQQTGRSDRVHSRSVSHNVDNRSGLRPNPSYRSSASEPLPREPTITVTQPGGGVLEVLSPLDLDSQHHHHHLMYTINEPQPRMASDPSITKATPLTSHPYSRSNSGSSRSSGRHSVDTHVRPIHPPRPPPSQRQGLSPSNSVHSTSSRSRPPPASPASQKLRNSRSSLSSFNFASPAPPPPPPPPTTTNHASSVRSSVPTTTSLASTTIQENFATEPSSSSIASPEPSPLSDSFPASPPLKPRRSRVSLHNLPSFRSPSAASSSTSKNSTKTPTTTNTTTNTTTSQRPQETNIKSPATPLITLANHVQTQTTLAQHLFNEFHNDLPNEEATWISRTIGDTQAATRDAFVLTESHRVDQAVHGGKVGLKSQVMWKVRDARRAKEKREALVLCHGSLVMVLTRLQAFQAQRERTASGTGTGIGIGTGNGNGNAAASIDRRRESTSQNSIGRSSIGTARTSREVLKGGLVKPDTPPWDLSVQLQDPGMELVTDKHVGAGVHAVSPIAEAPSFNEIPRAFSPTATGFGNDGRPPATKLDSEVLEMLSWRWNQGQART